MPCADPIEEHYRLVDYVANRFRRAAAAKGETFEDIMQVGYIGLLKAHRNFDPSRNLKFSTYAVPAIFGEIRIHFRNRTNKVYIGRPLSEYVDRIHRAGMHFDTAEEIAEKLKITLKMAKKAISALYANSTYSIDKPLCIDNNGTEMNLLSVLIGESDYSVAVVEDFISTLPGTERSIVRMYLDGKTQSEIGKSLSTSQVQVSRLLQRIRAKLQKYYCEAM